MHIEITDGIRIDITFPKNTSDAIMEWGTSLVEDFVARKYPIKATMTNLNTFRIALEHHIYSHFSMDCVTVKFNVNNELVVCSIAEINGIYHARNVLTGETIDTFDNYGILYDIMIRKRGYKLLHTKTTAKVADE